MSKARKILNMLVEERLTKDQYIPDANNAVEYFNNEIKKIFPNIEIYSKAYIKSGLGDSILYDFTSNIEDPSKPRVTQKNSFNFMCFLDEDDSFGAKKSDKFFIDSLSEYNLKKAGIPYRKLSANSPMEVTKKLIEWFKKNKEAISAYK